MSVLSNSVLGPHRGRSSTDQPRPSCTAGEARRAKPEAGICQCTQRAGAGRTARAASAVHDPGRPAILPGPAAGAAAGPGKVLATVLYPPFPAQPPPAASGGSPEAAPGGTRSSRPGRSRATGIADREAGMATAEYAIATLAAVAFAGLLVAVLGSGEVRGLLMGLIRSALSFG